MHCSYSPPSTVLVRIRGGNMRNDFAGIGAIGHLFAIIVVGVISAVMGLILDMGNNTFFTGLSGDGANTITNLNFAFSISIFLFLVAVIISHWINEKSMANQGV